MLRIIGLPLKTIIVVGGLFVFSALAPLIVALIIEHKSKAPQGFHATFIYLTVKETI